ncbi:MAG: endonuclease III [Calditrichaeota bacterium]|nr:MAG: endonuclease III [Calditrichota bacterium]
MTRNQQSDQRTQRVKKILEALERQYPEAPLELKYSNAFELLIAVLLSAQTTDKRVNEVTRQLFQKYRTPEDFLRVPLETLEQELRPTGYYRKKAQAVRAVSQMLVERFGGQVPRSIDQLVQLPGVGRKTAAMVLGNAYRINEGIAVDTHVQRVAQRLQLTDKKTPEKIEQDLMALVPREKWTWFSNALILHGRYVCQARKPRCEDCVLEPWCPYPDKNL